MPKFFKSKKKKNMISWLCFYEKKNYYDAENLYNNLSKASKGFGLKILEPEWIEMPDKATPKNWTDTVEDYIGKDITQSKYTFVVFLIGQKDPKGKLYCHLKKHSLCTNGYVSQVIKVSSLQKKGILSVCSKILLQINAKLGGYSYQLKKDNEDKKNNKMTEKNLMVVGIDSSYIKKKGRGIAMVATVNDNYTNFYNREEIIEESDEKNIKKIEFKISAFIEDAIEVYNEKNSVYPQGIIIYRQGVSLQQKEYLEIEINQIDEFLNPKDIDYYYILVNTKTTFKFFEIKQNYFYNKKKKKEEYFEEYYNPEPGLLIIDGVTNKKFFEFYIQPQQVTSGSATPTCFHVAYGNLDFANYIPKFTYDLCYIYSNWQGPVRVPNVIKAAEKLSKMTAKYTFEELNSKLEIGQAYL